MNGGKKLLWLVVAVGFATSVLGVQSEGQAAVWVEKGTTKVYKPLALAGTSAEVFLEAPRNEWEGFQVVIQASDEGMSGVSVVMSDLAKDEGAGTLDSSNARLYLEHYIHIDKPSPCDSFFSQDCGGYDIFTRTPGDYPDPLIPFYNPYSDEHEAVAIPFEVAAGDLQTVWVDWFVPLNAEAGEYSGTLTVTREKAIVAEIPVHLTVWDFELPTSPSMASSYGFGEDRVWWYHGGAEGPDAETTTRILDNYDLALHKHRMALRGYGPSVTFEFDEAGQLIPPDFTQYDAVVGSRISGAHYPDGGAVNRYNLGMFKPGGSMMGLTEEQYIQAAKAMVDHLEEKGWLSHVYLYSLDEPWMPEHWQDGSYDKIRTSVDLLRQASDKWNGHVMVTGPYQSQLDGYVDIWCPVVPMYSDVFYPEGSWPGPDEYAELLSIGNELWFYACNANYPGVLGYDLDAKIGYEPRLLKWGAWVENASGFLYWRTNYWMDPDPWANMANWEHFGEQFSRNGDGILLFPGDHNGSKVGFGSPAGVSMDGPIVSYRMKQIRDGFEDWELFIIASNLGLENYARDEIEKAYRIFGAPLNANFDINAPPFSLDEESIFEARRKIALKVQFTLHPDLYPDPDAPVVVEEEIVEGEDVVEQEETVEASELVENAADVPTEAEVASNEDVTSTPESKGSSSGCSHDTGSVPGLAWVLLLLGLLVGIRSRRSASPE